MKKNLSPILLVAFLVLIAVLSRFISHAWNMTLLGGLSIFCGAFFARKSTGVFVVLMSLLISDAVIGFHNQMLPVYGAFLVMMGLGSFVAIRSSRLTVLATSVLGTFLFFAITNFFVWSDGTSAGAMYPPTLSGLVECYIMGLPFYRNQLIGDVVSTFIFFEAAKALESFIGTRFDDGLVKIRR